MAFSGSARRQLAGIKRRMRQQRGFSLTEVVISLAILGVVGASVMFALDASSHTILNAHEKTVAESLTRTVIEYVKLSPYDDASNPPRYSLADVVDLDGDPYYGEYGIGPVVVEDGVTYLVTERLDTHADGTDDDDGVQKITVKISYQGKVALTTEAYKVNR